MRKLRTPVPDTKFDLLFKVYDDENVFKHLIPEKDVLIEQDYEAFFHSYEPKLVLNQKGRRHTVRTLLGEIVLLEDNYNLGLVAHEILHALLYWQVNLNNKPIEKLSVQEELCKKMANIYNAFWIWDISGNESEEGR